MTDLEFIGITATQRVDSDVHAATTGSIGIATHTEIGRRRSARRSTRSSPPSSPAPTRRPASTGC